MKKKILALLLSVAVAVCMIPMFAFAEGEPIEEPTEEPTKIESVSFALYSDKVDQIIKAGEIVPNTWEASEQEAYSKGNVSLGTDAGCAIVGEAWAYKNYLGNVERYYIDKENKFRQPKFSSEQEVYLQWAFKASEGYSFNKSVAFTVNVGGEEKEVSPDCIEYEKNEQGELVEQGRITVTLLVGTVPKSETVTPKIEKKTEPAKTLFTAQGKAKTKSISYSWTAVEGAATYKVYQAKCGKKYKRVKTTTGLSFSKKKLKKKTKYKAYVVACNASGNVIAQTPEVFVMTKNGKNSNATAVSAKSTVTMKVGATVNMGANIAKKDSKKSLLWKKLVKSKIRYYSADTSVATVDAKGNITLKKDGATNIYAVAPSGVCAKCTAELSGIQFNVVIDGKSIPVTCPYQTWQEAIDNNFSFTTTVGNCTYLLTAVEGTWKYEDYVSVDVEQTLYGKKIVDFVVPLLYKEHIGDENPVLVPVTQIIEEGHSYVFAISK